MSTLSERLQQGVAGLQAFQNAQVELLTEIKQEYEKVAGQVQVGVDTAGLDGRIDANLNREVGPWATKVQEGLNEFTGEIRGDRSSEQ